MADRRASSRPGDSYRDDAYYRPIEAQWERKYGLPDGLLASIRKEGERTNRDQVSSAGARSVYQIIPSTRNLFQNKYGVNAYAGDREAAQVAALHLKESFDRNNGNIENTVREYHGGTNRKAWGTVNDNYVSRVLGKSLTRDVRGTTVLRSDIDLGNVDVEALRDVRPADIGSRKPLEPKPLTAKDVAPKPSAAGVILGNAEQVNPFPGSTVQNAADVQAVTREAQVAEQQRASITFGDRFSAAMDRNWIVPMVARALDNDVGEGDPTWHKQYVTNMDEYEKFAENQEELDELRGSRAQTSEAEFNAVKQGILARRERNRIINSTGKGWAFDIGASIADPVGWIATAGVGKLLQVGAKGAQVGRAALASRTVTSTAVEGAVTNLAFTGLMDASGEHQSVGDYIMAGSVGAGIGAALHTVFSRRGVLDTSDTVALDAVAEENRALLKEAREVAEGRVSDPSNEGEMNAAMGDALRERAERIISLSVADRPDADRFLPLTDDLTRTSNQGDRLRAETAGNLSKIADPGTRGMAAEIYVRSSEIADTVKLDGLLDKGLEGKFLKTFGAESDALTMLRSKNPVMVATAVQLLESTTGAGGRKPSAAISKVMRERSYMGYLVGYDQAYDLWRRSEGIGKVSAAMSNDARSTFDRLVWREIEARGDEAVALTTNPSIRKAADALEEGFDRMRREQQAVQTLGHERLGTTSRGYMRHMMDPRKLMALNPTQRKNVENVMAKQFQRLNEYSYIAQDTGEKVTKAFDAKFSRELAKRYMDEAEGRAMGSNYVPANLETGEASSIIEDALKAMNGLSPAEAEAILGRFSRGGASFTKGRLKLDMFEDIGNGMQLGDLFNQDMLSLYRGYARRVSGEVALAQYGILGKQGLKVMRTTAQASGATPAELKAFERIAAEFLNEPWSGAQHIKWAQNLRAITSASMLGGMGFTQFGEAGNAMSSLGVRAVLSNVASMPRLLKEVGMFRKGGEAKNAILRDFDEVYGFIGGDEYMQTRLFDVPDHTIELYNDEAAGRFTKAIRAGSHFTTVASGFRAIHATQVRGMSELIVKKAIKYINEGTASKALDDMGISPEIRAAFKANMGKIAKFDKRGNLTSLEITGASGIPPRIIQDFAQTIERGAGQIIQKTYIGETGAWAHNDMLKLLLQFRTFGMTSIEKQWGRNVANYGAAKSFAILVGAMSFAFPIHLARMHAQTVGMSRSEREEFLEKKLNVMALSRATMAYASSSGLLPDILDVVTTIGNKVGVVPDELADQAGVRGRQPGLTGLIPGLGYTDSAYNAVVGTPFKNTDGEVGVDPNRVKKALKLLPGSNLPLVTATINGLTPEDTN